VRKSASGSLRLDFWSRSLLQVEGKKDNYDIGN